ncbi:MAG: hypothetical protein H3C35_13330 [Bacteroidetes bacterium]|nr:hypothetical protein [Bacteroidota bacterium]
MKAKFLNCFIIIFLLLYFLGCGATQPIRTLEEGASSVQASLGGPIIPFADLPVPVPYLNLGYAKGIQKNLTLFGNAHVTALLFKDAAFDAGIVSSFAKEKGMRPEITVKVQGNFFWAALRGREFRFLPTIHANGSYRVGGRSLFYFGAENNYDLLQSQSLFSPFIGYQFPLSQSLFMQAETKWIAANKDTRHGIFEGYASVLGQGNMGLFLAFTYRLNEK